MCSVICGGSTAIIEFFFFFSSRRRHTRFDCDWSSDVCSSDLAQDVAEPRGELALRRPRAELLAHRLERLVGQPRGGAQATELELGLAPPQPRSEERRVGKECRSRGSPYH